ncbi:unnamed protein product [Adineta steineri]|uniref:Uncharacterized protein n=1 Tax=Adineta steineri TaxID=433720 RepID=A0A814SDL7_9BILA|nr:unnamed protein product [Adineta steineri]CAF1318760.1 unnamed protein product [Adineta steineri]
MSSLNLDLEEIRQIVLKSNNDIKKISTKVKEQNHDESEEFDFADIKQAFQNNLQSLKNKLNSLPTSDIEDESIPVFHSTLNQLEPLLEKIRSDPIDDDVFSILRFPRYTEQSSSTIIINENSQESIPILRMDRHPLERNLESEQDTEMNHQLNFHAQLSKDLKFMEKQARQLKTIADEYYQRKLRKFFTKLQSKHDNDCESYKQRKTIYTDLKEYSKYCVELYKYCVESNQSLEQLRKDTNSNLKVTYRRKLKDDLQFRQCFHIFLVQFQKDLFHMVLSESKDYIPRSSYLIDCLKNDKYYNLYVDQEQLGLIYEFVRNIYYSASLEKLHNCISIKTPYLKLIVACTNDPIHANYYINELKEFYLVFVRDSILSLKEEDQEIIESDETVQSLFDEMKKFYEQKIKIIQNSEKVTKNLFIRQFRGTTWDEKLINDRTVSSQNTDEEESTSTQEDTADSDEHFDAENNLMNTEGSPEDSVDLFQQSEALKKKKPSLKLYLKKSIELLNKSIAIDKSLIDSSIRNNQEKSNAKDQLRRKIEFRALIYLDMANKYKFPCFEKFSCFNQSKYDFIEYDKQMTDETNVQFNKKNFIHLFRQAFAVDDISSMKLYNNVLQINPYFFEAQYQKLLKFYELNDCEISHIHETFTELVKSNKPIVDLFEALIDVKVCHDDKKNGQTSVFFNKIFKIEINDENEELYIQFSKTKYSTEIKLNKKKQLIKLLKHGQKHIIIVKTNPDKLSKLKCHLSNLDFNDLLTTASNSIEGTFAHLLRSDNPVEDLFDILIPIYLKQCHDRNNRKSLTFFDKILKIKVKNNQNKSLYLHFSKTQYSDQVKYNNEEQLINLLKYGSGGMIKMKKTSNKSSKLKYQLSNSDFEQFIRSLINRIDKQEPKFLKLIQLFKELESVNENEYQKLDETFRIILPETRFTLIKCTNNSNHCQTICEISRSIEEFESLNNPKKLSILQLKFQRAKIYRKNLYFNLEELEFFDILNYQKTNRDHNPMIYYRLSYLSKQKGDLQMSIHYINLASKKYNEKSNKKIFKEIEKFKSDLLKLENVQTDDLAFFDKNKMNLFKIFNLITKFNFQSYSYVTLGFHLFTDELINCLFYHLIEEHDVEEYLKYHDNTLTKTYRELHEESVSEEEFINKFNEKFKTNFKCFFVEEGIDSRMLTYTNNQVPIVLIKTSNFYTTIKEVNYFMFLTVLLTTYDAKSDLKSVCSIFLNNEISKNILTDAKENQNIERFIQAMIECKNMKVFNEEIIYYLKTDNYNQYCLDFWSLIADLDYNLVLTDILNDFKELFIESIEEYRTDKEKEHKSALELIDDIIEENARTQKFWNLLNKLKEEIIKSLSIYENVSSKSDKRKKLMEIIISTDEIDDKFQEIISVDCFQIDLNFTDASEEQSFYQYIKTSQESEIPFQLLSLIQDALSAPEINIQNSVIIVKGYNIFFSDIIENIQTKIPDLNIKEVQFYGTNVFIDMSLNNECWYGINLIIGSDIIDFIKDDKLNTKITINLTGKKGSDGNNAKHQPNATRESEDGLDGLPGENGQVGGNGGNIYFIVKKQLKRRENIEKLTTSGGDGGQGGNGGNGGDGQNGKIGDDATEGNGLPTLYRGYYLSRGKPGTRGGDGGQGGDAGFGGFGGHPGIVYIEENQTKINDALNPDKIESIDKSNISAEHGEHGEGGKSGVGGSDGLDVLEYRYHNFGKKKIYYGYIKITKVQWGFFTYTVEFIYEERPKKKPGISGNQGKAADQQINSGKIRRKSEDKEKSNEQQIKNQLNQLIHNNNERTNNISNNITHSIYLLQDQKEELLNERDTQVKTHQLSNSLLKKAFATAHKSFKLNMENTKSKTENNIIRTPDTNANHDNKSTIQSELSVDEHPKENIQFKTCDPIIQRLTESYNPEKDRLIKFLDENIKEKDDKIILLKRKGKHILFKIDIDSMNDSFITDRNEINQINLLHLNGTRLSTMDGDLINQDFSLLRNRYKNALYYCNSKQHAPFVLKQYLDDLKKLPKEKKSFLRTRHKLNQLNVDTFINEICLEYGNEELIKWKMTKFAQIIKSDGLQGTKDFDSFDMNNFIKQNDFPIDEVNAYETHLTNLFLNEQNLEIFKEISRILIESKLSIKRIERSQNFLTLLFNLLQSKKIFKEFKLNDCTPIYHPKNEPINMYVIEQLMYQFLQSKDKNLELLARIFNCFRKIVEKESDEILYVDTSVFVQNVKDLYEQLRGQKLEDMNKQQEGNSDEIIDLSQSNYNEKIGFIYLISGQLDNAKEMQIKNGNKIVITKNMENQYMIYFRDNQNFEVRQHLLDKEALLRKLNGLKFDTEVMLSKETDKDIYKNIYEEIESKNGFTEYSTEQIEFFNNLKEFVYEKLDLLKNKLEPNTYQYIANEINYVFDSESPDLWLCRTHFILYNLNIIIDLQAKFKNELELPTSIETLRSDLKDLLTNPVLKDIIEHLLNGKEDGIIIIFFKLLSIFDHLLIKITKKESNTSVKDQIKQIGENLCNKFQLKDDLRDKILYEIIMKNNQILKRYYFDEILNIYEEKRQHISSYIDSSPLYQNKDKCKESFQTHFQDLINNGYLTLFDYIDEIYVTSSNKLKISMTDTIYSELMQMIKIFFDKINANSEFKSFIDETVLFRNRLQNYCVILTSELNNIPEIAPILNEFKINMMTFEKCSIRRNDQDRTTQDQNEIILSKISEKEFQIVYRRLQDNKIAPFILKKDQDAELFLLMNETITIGDQTKFEKLYSMINAKNGSIYKNNIFFDEKIFIEIFINRILKHKSEFSIETLTTYFNSFEIILKNSTINFNILLSLDEFFQNLIKKESNEQFIELFNQFSLLIDKEYENLIGNLENDFANLSVGIKRKNRILNITFNYLSKCLQEKTIETIEFKKNDILNTTLEIKNILQIHKLQLSDILQCYDELNVALILAPLSCLKIYKQQLDLLNLEIRLFIEIVDCSLQTHFNQFNNELKQTKSVDHQLIFNLLKIVTENSTLILAENYQSIMKRILLNFEMTNDEFNWPMLQKIENQITKCEKIQSIRMDYRMFIVKITKFKLISKYKDELTRYEEEKKKLNDLIQKIVDLFWSNISNSDLLNKEREKTYVILNIEKLLKLCNTDFANAESILIDLQTKIRGLQKNSDKKQFTNDIHMYLNKKINSELYKFPNIILPINLDDNIKNRITYILGNNYTYEDSTAVFKEFSVLFEESIDKFDKNSSKYNEFFESFNKIFQYFSWRLLEYNPTSKQDVLNEAIERFTASMQRFKDIISSENIEQLRVEYNHFYEFENIFHLRTHDNQLQQELNMLQSDYQVKRDIIDQIKEGWLKNISNCLSVANPLITERGELYDDQIPQLFLKNIIDLQNLKSKENSEVLNGTTDNATETEVTEEGEEEEVQISTEQISNAKIPLEMKFSVLNELSCQMINKEEQWNEKKGLIEKFDLIKEKLFDEYLKTMFEQRTDRSLIFDTFKNSIQIKHIKEIITQTAVDEWNREMCDLSVDLFLVSLLKFYNFDCDNLKSRFISIEKSVKDKQTNDDDDTLTIWQTEITEKKNAMEIINYILAYSKENVDSFNLQTTLFGSIKQFINDVNSIQILKSSIDTLYFFVGYENFMRLAAVLQMKLINSSPTKLNLEKLAEISSLLSSTNNFNRAIKFLENFHLENWLLYLNYDQIENDLNMIFNRYFDQMNFNDLKIENLNRVDEFIESEFYQTKTMYDQSFENISKTLKLIKLNQKINVSDKEMFFRFLRSRFIYELKKDSNCLINFNDLQKIFLKYLTDTTIIRKIINSLTWKLDDENPINDQLIIEDIHSKTFNSLLPYLIRFWIIKQLELDKKALEDERTKIIQYFEIIKTLYSEEKMFQLIGVIQEKCKDKKIISQNVIDLLINMSNNEWLLNEDILNILRTTEINEWGKRIEDYMEKKRSIERDFRELINLMKEDRNSLNKLINDYLNSENILSDLQALISKRKEKIDFNKPVENWTIADIQEWAKKTRGNRLLLSKEAVQNTIVVVSQGINLFRKYYPRDTQILALWLFLNPDLNNTSMGCLAQISTGEGKSIIVAALAAIKALGCHRIDVMTSSNVLAIRDAKEFQSFFEMFGLQVSNNCDMFCEQGDGKQSAEEIRKLRYYNSSGPVDIIYGECSCFERDILLTEFNKNDRNQNIIGQRLSKNSVSSVIIDEVDSMLLDKANMVLYLSHNTDTLKSLERIFISIWQTINQPTLDAVRDHMIDDDLIESVTDIILDQIDQKAIEIPEYDSRNCDYINMRLFTERRMPVWIRSAFHVRDMIPNDTYIISRDKSDKSSKSEVQITVMDKDTGTEQLSTRWSNGVHQFLQLKHMRRFTPESLKAGFISNMSFFKRYQNHIVGLTGSLGSIDEQFLLNKVYQLRFFELPRFKQELFRELKGTMTTSQDTWLESIKNALDREIKSKLGSKDRRRAVLIICENVKNVLVLKEYLASSYPNAKDYKSAYEDFKIDQLNPGDIIIATNLAGRGTDLETSDKLEENGGLHVITTYLPSNIRIEMQAFGRTARKGNKGTGEYIIISQYGLSIETLKQLRNCQEKERLDSFLINDLPKIQIEEDLLQGFTDDNQLSCIGFTKLYQNIEKKLSSDRSVQYHGYQYKQFQLNSLKNRWAFWLDSMTESINMINVIGKKTIIEKFNEFQSAIEKDVEANTFEKLIIEPCELIKLGKYYRDCGNWWKALICYQQAGLDRFYASANYYTSSCRQNINYVNGINSKREFKHSLILVKQSIEKEMQFLNNAAQVAFEIGEKNRKLGLANYGNEYDKQVKEKSTIWNIFSDTVINALGTSIDPKDLTANKYLSDEKQAEKLFDSLKKNKDKYIKSSRITKKTINSLELPSIFNNKKTNDSLINYLRKKSEIRCSNDLDELNEEIFKKDLKKSKIFLPDLNSFIDLIEKENGFIEQIENKEEDELFLFQSFNEENLNKEKFPHEILNIKKSLFDWLKEISEEKGMTGTKNDILIKLNNFLISKNQQNVTEDQWTKIYGFLIKHSCLQKLKQYLVKKDKIMKPIDGDYKYFNLYNFEHHYTDEFEKFDSVLRQNFLKIFVIQEDPEDGESYITLKETINTSDFNLCKTKEEAINYLWSYLRSTPLIKPPRINIPLESLKEVNRKRKGIEKEIKLFLEREIPKDKKNELEEAIKAVFNIIDQTIGDLKKMPDDKTITSYLQIKTSCFLDNKKRIPEALDEFIDLAFDVIFQLQEKKDPPQWYEIAAVIALGLLQIAAGVLATAFIPFAGQLIGEFLISTGCDDILFGISCAMSGEFSWEKYWEHKKQSMKTSAISAVVFVSVSFVKNARRLQSCKKAWAFQKLKGAQKLRTAAAALNTTANVSKYVGKEIAKTLVKTGLAELASMGINKVLDTLSNTYESELHGKITDSLKSKWNIIETEMLELFRVTEGKNSMKIIDDCINRKLQNLSEDGAFKNFTRRCGPVIQGLGKALADVNGTKGKIINALMSYAPTLIGLGISVNDIICMISSFIQSLTADLKDARKSLKKTNQEYQLTEENETDFKKYKKEKFDQISSCLSENFNQKLKSGILAPVLNFASNMMISRGIEYVAGTDRVEQLANTFELIHAASNSSDTKPRYTENLAIYLAEARHIDITLLNIDPKNIYPENGDGENLEKLIDTNGNALKVFYGKDGKFYVQIPSPKKYCEGVLDDKPAGIYEQKTIDVVLECEVIKGKVINGEQQCTLKRRGGSDVKFVIKDNGNGKKHAELLIDGKSISIDTNRQNKNDCYYVVVLVANEVSQGKSFEEARNILDDRNAVLNLRKNVSSVMKNDPEFLKKFEWANRTDRQVHYNSLVGSYTDSDGTN